MSKPFYPFLFAVFPILSLYAYNLEETPFTHIFLPLLFAIAGTVALFFGLALLVKDKRKAALLSAWILALFFSYGHAQDIIFPLKGNISPIQNFILLGVWSVLWIVGSLLILRLRRNLLTSLNIISIMLTLTVLATIGISAIVAPPVSIPKGVSAGLSMPSDPPDIYYIILDTYSRQDDLMELLGYDNSEFISHLKDRGFYIGDESCCNYNMTRLSMASSLNMRYFGKNEPSKWLLIADNEVSRQLNALGYRYIHIPTWIDLKYTEDYAEVYSYKGAFGIRVTEFMFGVVETTILAPFARYFGTNSQDSILNAFNILADVPDKDAPVFVVAHICCPHPPWFFDEDGVKDYDVFAEVEGFEKGYLDNLKFINKKVKVLVVELLEDENVIVILQGDTGMGYRAEETFSQTEILNAYYFPNKDYELLYPSISPVNTFRVVFNQYFGADYELLEDKNYEP